MGHSSYSLICSHEQFVDDIIFLGKAIVREARSLKMALNLYSLASIQLINWNKISPFFINTPEVKQTKIYTILG